MRLERRSLGQQRDQLVEALARRAHHQRLRCIDGATTADGNQRLAVGVLAPETFVHLREVAHIGIGLDPILDAGECHAEDGSNAGDEAQAFGFRERDQDGAAACQNRRQFCD
jgi:hypothetical protein